jgi:hypothetical protein
MPAYKSTSLQILGHEQQNFIEKVYFNEKQHRIKQLHYVFQNYWDVNQHNNTNWTQVGSL